MANPTLATLRAEAQYHADAVNDPHKSTTEWTAWINDAGAELYDELASTFEDYYTAVTGDLSPNATTGILAPVVPVTLEILKVRAVEKQYGGDWLRVEPVNGPERGNYRRSSAALIPYSPATDCVYDYQGQAIYILPIGIGGTFRAWYVPCYAPMTSDSHYLFGITSNNSLLIPDRWWQYVTLGAAIRARMKEESDFTALAGLQQQVLMRIRTAARSRKPGGQRIRETASHRDTPMRRYR